MKTRAFLHRCRRIVRRYYLRIILILARLRIGPSTVVYSDEFLLWLKDKKAAHEELEHAAKKMSRKMSK